MVCVPEVTDFVELYALNHSVVNDIVESIVRAPHVMRLIGYLRSVTRLALRYRRSPDPLAPHSS